MGWSSTWSINPCNKSSATAGGVKCIPFLVNVALGYRALECRTNCLELGIDLVPAESSFLDHVEMSHEDHCRRMEEVGVIMSPICEAEPLVFGRSQLEAPSVVYKAWDFLCAC